jgi:hypothetical protein
VLGRPGAGAGATTLATFRADLSEVCRPPRFQILPRHMLHFPLILPLSYLLRPHICCVASE